MHIYKGKSVSGGIAIGKICVYAKSGNKVTRTNIQDKDGEIRRYREAVYAADAQLRELYESALREVGPKDAEIFEMHRVMLMDEEYRESIENIIDTQSVNAEYAVAQTAEKFVRMFSDMDDYMGARAADVKDISERLILILQKADMQEIVLDEPSIIVADDLTPSETLRFDRSKILAFVTLKGSADSHSAILARTMGIPALTQAEGIPLDESVNGKVGIVDGENAKIYVEPDEETLGAMDDIRRGLNAQKELLRTFKGKPDVTLDGQNILLYANIIDIKDLPSVLENDADGIGLFRSESVYLERNDYPTEDEQFQIYRKAAETMGQKEVIIRTLDIGADKECDYFGMPKEDNPALGCRAIRICLTRPEIFKTQLRAILRASVFGNISVMYPMIISVEEIRKIKKIVGEVREELDKRGVEYGNPRQGIMIETPAAAIISDKLAGEVDFFSIGTNDLTQYLLAIDRKNAALDEFRDARHPAVMRMIETVVDNAHKAGIRVGICGELGADTTLTQEFLAMGVDELSVSPECVLPIRKIVSETNVAEYRKHRQRFW